MSANLRLGDDEPERCAAILYDHPATYYSPREVGQCDNDAAEDSEFCPRHFGWDRDEE